MKSAGLFVLSTICGVAAMVMPKAISHLHTTVHGAPGGTSPANGARVHTEEQFMFTARGTIEQVAPLFGAEKERVWASDWDPQFLHPHPAADHGPSAVPCRMGQH